MFLPVVVQYLSKLDSDISRDLRLLFSMEKWPQEWYAVHTGIIVVLFYLTTLSPCVATIAACLEALHSIQRMIQELQWPDKDVSCHLQQRCHAIYSEQLQYSTSM